MGDIKVLTPNLNVNSHPPEAISRFKAALQSNPKLHDKIYKEADSFSEIVQMAANHVNVTLVGEYSPKETEVVLDLISKRLNAKPKRIITL